MSNEQIDELWQYSDNVFKTRVTAIDGQTTVANNSFSAAEYIIADRAGTIKFFAELGSGIERDANGDDFVTTIDDGELDFFGAFEHQFVVYDLSGNRLPPIFKRKLRILQTFKKGDSQ